MRGPEGGYGLMHAERASVSRRLPRSFGPDNAPAEKDRTSPRVPPTSSLHTLSVSGADHPSSRYHPLRFCLSAIPTCRYLRLLDIAFHALPNARYRKLRRALAMAVSVPVCGSTLSMQWGHNAAALGLPPVRGARVVSESPPRYDFLHEGAATGQSHPRRAPPPQRACAHAAPWPRPLESKTSAPAAGGAHGAADSGGRDVVPFMPIVAHASDHNTAEKTEASFEESDPRD